MSCQSRRTFLAKSSLALAGLHLGCSRSAIALPVHARQPVSTFLPDLIDAVTLRALAQAGIDAARDAGATYADCRVSDLYRFEMVQGFMVPPWSDLDLDYSYGLRVLVDGAWGHVFGVDPTTDGIVRAARAAVATARGVAKVASHAFPMAPAPVVHGEWTTPIKIDPFSVSPDEHAKTLGAYKETSERTILGGMKEMRFQWVTETRVLASTEGSLITQRLFRWRPTILVGTLPVLGKKEQVSLPVPGFAPQSVGFEATQGAELQERIKATTEEAIQLLQYPEVEADVGRYPAVLDGTAVGGMLGATLAPALEVERVLGYEANGEGTSFLGPVDDILGQPLFSPMLNVAAERALPHYGAAKWDDEGVETTASFPVIQQGKVVDYFTSRASVSVMANWYAKRRQSLTTRGSAVAWAPTMAPTGSASCLTMHDDASGVTLNTLVKQLGTGLLVRGVKSRVSADQQVAGGMLVPEMLYEVKQGQITRRLRHGALQFGTKAFWKALSRVGDATTTACYVHSAPHGDMLGSSTVPITAPAAQLHQVDIIAYGRKT